ncbi:MAG: protein kinase [Anaerolineales bacterium]|nr:protein kinase [Anaerolineales bacterium]
MATVFAATDPSFERQVAIKVLPHAFLHDPQFRARFEREAKTVAALEHAAIVPVYDFGEDDGQPFIVMRLMAGGSLADRLQDDKLSIEEAVRIIIRLAPALDAAHKKGIIHRDLKPGNILFDQYDNAFLSDFGIARLTEAGATLTGSNILGTPAYMSPEQVQGDKDLDGRSDLYSLGVIFYQMLIGHTPYQATTPAKVMMMHILEPVPDLLLEKPDLPPAVKAWLEKCLAKDPANRFANATEMAVALETAMRGEIHPTLQAKAGGIAQKPGTPATVQATPNTVLTPGGGIVPPATPYPAAPRAVSKPKKKSLLPITLLVIGFFGIGVIAILVLAFIGFSGSGPLAILAGATDTPQPSVATATATDVPIPTETEAVAVVIENPTETPTIAPSATDIPVVVETATATPEPSPTEMPTPAVPVYGGADAVAFIKDNDIWVMNLDGSELHQLTTDRAEKTNLNWTPDGSMLTYISGKCAWGVDYETERVDYLACFEAAEYLESFTVSPDGSQVAISLNRELYIVPFDLEKLAQARYRSDLMEMSTCPAFSPLQNTNGTIIATKLVRWSSDGSQMALEILVPVAGKQADAIRLVDIGDCQNQPVRLDEFPAQRFTIEGYEDNPVIQNFGYDGQYLFALVNYYRNDGFGHMYIYNANTRKPDLKINPINGTCCYRDPQFSPDGSYMVFVYQPFEAGALPTLYLVRYATIGAGGIMEPLPLPEGFFTDIKAKPQPVLRPAP